MYDHTPKDHTTSRNIFSEHIKTKHINLLVENTVWDHTPRLGH